MPEASAHGPVHIERVPTLTEVVELGGGHAASPAGASPAVSKSSLQSAPYPIDTALLVRQVLAEIAPHLDERFEARLQAALAPAVARAVGGLLTESRVALAGSMRELVEEAVARAVGTGAVVRGGGRK